MHETRLAACLIEKSLVLGPSFEASKAVPLILGMNQC